MHIHTHIYKGGPALFIRFPESVCTGVYSSDFVFLGSLQMYCSTGSDKWKALSYEIYENLSYKLKVLSGMIHILLNNSK